MSANKSITCCRLHHLNAHWGFLVIFIFIYLFLPSAHSSVYFSITDFQPSAKNIIYEGDAKPSLGAIELNTIDYTCRVGRAVYSDPIRLWDSSTLTVADFTTHFSFTINTKNASIYGNGFAFFLGSVNHQIPLNSAGGYLGLLNSTTTTTATSENHIITVEFDSYINPDWDPPTQHVGINNNSMKSAVYAPWNAGLYSNLVANAWITYNATTKNLCAFWTYDEHPVFESNCSLSYKIDLMKYLPEWVKIGFSAGTGQYVEYNTIKSWEFTSNLDAPEGPGKRKSIKTYVRILVPVCTVVLVIGIFTVVWLRRKRSKRPRTQDGRPTSPSNHKSPKERASPIQFSYEELFAATNGFANDEWLGKGGSANVYKGKLEDKGLVAVKRIFEAKSYSFDNELKIVSRLKHPNLVTLVGWCQCSERNELLLVYEYMPKDSLASHLHGNGTVLPWNVRYKIVEDLVKAIQYLHQGADPCIIHRDIKPENALLDKYFTAKLSDFGIAKLTSLTTTQSSTGPGTAGYQAPEYMQQPKASKEADMYSFGIVALEIASGKNPNDEEPRALFHAKICRSHREGNVIEAADGKLEGNFDKDQMETLLMVGIWCTRPCSSERPDVGRVIRLLQNREPLSGMESELPTCTCYNSASTTSRSDPSEVEEDHSSLQIHNSENDNRFPLEIEGPENVDPA